MKHDTRSPFLQVNKGRSDTEDEVSVIIMQAANFWLDCILRRFELGTLFAMNKAGCDLLVVEGSDLWGSLWWKKLAKPVRSRFKPSSLDKTMFTVDSVPRVLHSLRQACHFDALRCNRANRTLPTMFSFWTLAWGWLSSPDWTRCMVKNLAFRQAWFQSMLACVRLCSLDSVASSMPAPWPGCKLRGSCLC